jgi:hypothetical protein
MTLIKNPTRWRTPSGTGYIVTIGNEVITTNSGLTLTDNLGNSLVTNPTYTIPKNKTVWKQSGA